MNPISKDGPILRGLIGITNGLCKALHVPCPPVTFVTIEVESPDGTIVHAHKEKANSWVRNAHNLLICQMLPSYPSGTYGAGATSIKDTSGSTKTSATYFPGFIGTNLNAIPGGPVNDNSYGIVVGTGIIAENFEDASLQSIIPSGTNSGQLSYQAGTLGTASYNGTTKNWTQTMSRVLNNNTASPIIVSEVGWYTRASINNSSSNVMIDRSLLASPVTVPAAYKLTVTYTTEYTMPA